MINMTRTYARRGSARRASRWTLTALTACVLAAGLSTAATASHDSEDRTRRGPGRVFERINQVWCDDAPQRRPAQRQYRRGYAAGKEAGWAAGFEAARSGCDWNPKPQFAKRKFKKRSQPYRIGYARGYAESYAAGYRKGIWQQQHRHRRQHRFWLRW